MNNFKNPTDQDRARADWNTQSRDLASRAWSGADCSGATRAAQCGAIVAVADMLLDALPSDLVNINRRCIMDEIESPSLHEPSSQIKNLFKEKNKEILDEKATPSFTEKLNQIGPQNLEPLKLYASALMRIIEGTENKERERLIKVASDYAWRTYCVRFHIPTEQQAGFPKGTSLLDWDQVHQLNKSARFENGAVIANFKSTLCLSIVLAAPAESWVVDRHSVVEGLSCCYLNAWHELRHDEVARLSKTVAAHATGFNTLMGLGANPLWAFFGPALEAEHGLRCVSSAPGVPTVDLDKLAIRRDQGSDLMSNKTSGTQTPIA